ncbi:MAG: hypothetical protein QM631_17490 [Dysgonomonas sp.]
MSRLKDGNGSYYIRDFTPVPTVHTLTELAKHTMNNGWTEEFLNEVHRVWPVFHFLPGNFDAEGNYRKNYTGALNDKGSLAVWEYDEEAKEQFKLMCLPDSLLVEKMVGNLNHRSPLHEIGLRMHTLADTWAHTYYSGVPAWFNNDVSKGGGTSWLPNAPYYNSYTYLGHCRAGSYPDYPYKKFTFTIQWSKDEITKDNPSDFLLALRQMVEALSCIRNHRSFKVGQYATIDSTNQAVITSILNTLKDDQCATWKSKIPQIKINGKALEVPKEYDSDKWLNAVKATSGDLSATDYYKFNAAAVKHLHFVKTALRQERIFLDDIPQERIIRCHVKLKENRYISSIINKLDPDAIVNDESVPENNEPNEKLPYASVGTTPVTLELIFPNDDTLKCGTNIRIRTTEASPENGEYIYLGAWKTNTYLYYYIKDYYLFQQKWSIEQSGVDAGTPIDLSKSVMIKNKHFTTKPYLQPRPKSSDRLTTQGTEYAIDQLIENASPGYLLLIDNYPLSPQDKFVEQAGICHQALVASLSAREQLAVVACTKYGDPIYPTGEDPRVVTISGSRKEIAEAGKAIKEYSAWRNESNLGASFHLINQMLRSTSTDNKYYVLFTAGNSIPVGLDPAGGINPDIPLFVHAAYPTAADDHDKYKSMLALNGKSRYYFSTTPSDIMLQYHYIKGMISDTYTAVNQLAELSGSYCHEKEFYVGDYSRMQISIVWSDYNYQYTSGDAGGHRIKVYLVEPSGERYPGTPSVTDDGFCLFDITHIPQGKWTLFIEYGIPADAPIECGIGVFLYIPNNKH